MSSSSQMQIRLGIITVLSPLYIIFPLCFYAPNIVLEKHLNLSLMGFDYITFGLLFATIGIMELTGIVLFAAAVMTGAIDKWMLRKN